MDSDDVLKEALNKSVNIYEQSHIKNNEYGNDV